MKKDIYLQDHIYEGTVLMPLVMSIEAIVQNAQAISKHKYLRKIENITINEPIIISEEKEHEIRIICISKNDDPYTIRGIIKSENDNFQKDIVSADIFFSDNFFNSDPVVFKNEIPLKGIDAERFYPKPLFQGPIFRHLTKIHKLIENKTCIAGWEKGEERIFFSDELPQKTFTHPSLIDSMMQSALITAGKILLPVKIGKISFFNEVKSEKGFVHSENKAVSLYDNKKSLTVKIEKLKTEDPKKIN